MRDVRVALVCEGPQDVRFLSGIIKRTVEDILQQSPRPIDVADVEIIPRKKGSSQVENIINAAKESLGRTILIVHVDADSDTVKDAIEQRIQPGIEAVEAMDDQEVCKDIVPLVPRRMIENWILADKNQLKENIGTDKEDQALGCDYPLRSVENIATPKRKIEEVIQNALDNQPRRRRRRQRIKREDLYEPKGQDIDLEILATISSYKGFKDKLEAKLTALNYLR